MVRKFNISSFSNFQTWNCYIELHKLDFPGSASDKESSCQCRRCKTWGFSLWAGKMPGRRARQPTLVSLPGEPYGQRSLGGCGPPGAESDAAGMTWHALHRHPAALWLLKQLQEVCALWQTSPRPRPSSPCILILVFTGSLDLAFSLHLWIIWLITPRRNFKTDAETCLI